MGWMKTTISSSSTAAQKSSNRGTGQLLSFDVGRDLDAGKPELAGAATELIDRGRRVLQRDSPEAEESVGASPHQFGQIVVDDPERP